MLKKIKQMLSSTFPEEILDAFLETYEKVKDTYRAEDFTETLAKSGKFAENTFRLLHYLDKRAVLKEVKNMQALAKSIEANTKYSDAVRLIIPRVTLSIIQTMRSKKDSVHIKEIIPGFMDATLNMTAANWIISELLREFSSADEVETVRIIEELMKKNYPLIQTFEGTDYVVRDIGAEPEMLLHLHKAGKEGINRKEIRDRMKNSAAPTISNLLKKLQTERKIYVGKTGQYYITATGEKHISEILMSK